MRNFKTLAILFVAAIMSSCGGDATTKSSTPKQMDYSEFTNKEYWDVVSGRAAKIVTALGLNDTEKDKRIQDLIASQYYRLNGIYDGNDAKIKKMKDSGIADAELDTKREAIKAQQTKDIQALHDAYVKVLSEELTKEQVDMVKDGMTYNVAPNTYRAFLDMIPDLTDPQKKFIWDALVEARDHAMDAGSSKEKHGWFGKYKGRINNYLSKEGYDLNTISAEWHERLRARDVEL